MANARDALADVCDDTTLSMLNLSRYCDIPDAKATLRATKSGDLTVLYMNIGSLPLHWTDFSKILEDLEEKPDIIAFSETKITEKCCTYYHPYLEGYSFKRVLSKTHFGGVGFFIRNELNYTLRPDLNCSWHSLFEMLWFEVSSNTNSGQKSVIGIVYRHSNLPNIPCFTRKMENILNKLDSEKANYYVIGDFNCNLLKINEYPNIADFANTMHSLNALNLINKPTRFPRGNQRGDPSLLDHLWTNQPHHISKVDLIKHPISDHTLSVFSIELNKKVSKTYQNNIFTHDWTNFRSDDFNDSLFDFLHKVDVNSDIHKKFSDLQNHIALCIEKHAPLRMRTRKEQKFSGKPWISESLQISIDNKNNLYKYLLTHNNPDLKKKYNKMKKILKKTVFRAEQNFYGRLFTKFQNSSRKIWGLINGITCRKKRDKNTINTIKMANGTSTSDPKIIADTLNDYFTNIGQNLSDQLPSPQVTYQQFLKNRQRNSFYLRPTDPMEVLEIIESFSKNSLGPDKIPPKFVRIGAPALSNILSELINECFETGIYPDSLKIARLTPIHKGDSIDQSCNYRPISILSILSKIMEKLTYNRLIRYIDKNCILNSNQFGFRKAHSTVHAITSIYEQILENINNDEHTISIYLDLSKAFDCVNHNILLSKLEHYGVRGVALNFFKSYLSNRKQYTVVNGHVSDLLNVICGVPQGSTLGPLLFLLYINDLATASKFAASLFADDTSLLLKHKDISYLERQCNIELVHINNWFLANRLTANLSKASKYMLTLGKSRLKHPDRFELKMGDSVLEKVNSIKYLGVIFDEKFKWEDHISYISSKISCSVGILSKLRYYTNIETLIKVYHSLVGSHLSYGLGAWGKIGVTTLQPLRVLQNRAIRFISRAPRYRRLDNDYLNLRILKLDDLYEVAVLKFMHQYYNDKLPHYFDSYFRNTHVTHRYNLRHNPDGRLCPINCKKVSMEKSIRFYGPIAWEKLPSSEKNLSFSKFKKVISNKILAEY